MASPKTRTHYVAYTDLRGDGRIVLYKRADHDDPSWTVRIKIPRIKGFVVSRARPATSSRPDDSPRTCTTTLRVRPVAGSL